MIDDAQKLVSWNVSNYDDGCKSGTEINNYQR